VSDPASTPIAIIGFGEVGTLLSRGFRAAPGYPVAVYDILFDRADTASPMLARAQELGVRSARDLADAAAGARIVISAVTASSSTDVAREAGETLTAGQFFLDLNSVSPRTKRTNADAVQQRGARYVEAAVMAPILPAGMRTPMLLGGEAADELRTLLAPAGMQMDVVATAIGRASAIKMCRSIMIKGLEALTVECLLTARMYGVEGDVIASLHASNPEMHWDRTAGYLIERVVRHGRRRAAEMRESAVTVGETGMKPSMASAIADRQDAVADLVARDPSIRDMHEGDWREVLDALATVAELRPMHDA
jgi:3-hydroxyisobutyrate dehydrogenase-like beta-hydroxyacid dehydrogenase